ncbi:hypothetical protein GO495_00225 [Chitinophaga oryziterrae]|uniref:DUF5018 domain-containing protein n=1 Tax=Chitinophaga oryziterrae TaxID=1031224 RepID=A0A6N8J4B3_9BACT|nr:hypothetical protein [Chitinophaga oryziterrae]MVT38992.1 hypothetical protein [Chitinophaga oryziterrae]
MRFNYTLIIAFILFICACKKETVNAPYPYNEITSFTVNDHLEGAINDGNIILYWPSSEVLPDSISPVISVSENATVSPASGQKIALKDSVIYIVTSQSGSVAKYVLHLNINQPDILLNENADVLSSLGSTLDLGNLYNVITDTAKTSIYLISKTGVITRLSINGLGYGGYANWLQANVPEEGVDTGWYKIKINSGIRSITSNRYFVYVAPGVPELILTDAFTLKRGDTHTFPGKFLPELTFIRARYAPEFTYYNLEIVSRTPNGVTVRIPGTYPLGSYSKLQISYVGTDGYDSYVDIPQSFTVTE